MRKIALIGSYLLLAAFLLSGCSPWIRLEQPQQVNTFPLEPGRWLQQTFTAHENGLQGIAVYISPSETGGGEVQLSLRENSPGASQNITATIPLASIQQPGWYKFNFPGIDGSAHKDYLFELSLTGSGSLSLAAGPADSYLDGSLYQDGQPVEAQAAFRLAYDPLQAAAGLAGEAASWAVYLLAAAWLFLLPGWGLLSILYRGWSERSWIEKTGLAAGSSLALYPLIFLWTGLVGLHLGAVYAWLPGLAGAILIGYNQVRQYREQGRYSREPYKRENLFPDILLLLMIGSIIFSRLWVIRELDFPLWGDSYQHTMIAQLMVDNRGLFNSWQPYADLQTFTYHFGFHTLVAAFHWLTGSAIPAATLWTGQLINIMAIITLAPLAMRLGGNRWAAVVAITVAGLLSPMPQAYLNWGRYTQLVGQAILPVAVALSFAYLEDRATDRRLAAMLALVLGGLALSHYRIIIFAVLFYVAYFILKSRQAGGRTLMLKITWIGLGGALLCLPWLVHVFSGGIPAIAAHQLSTPVTQLSAFATQYNTIGNIGAYLHPVIWIFVILAAGWGAWRRDLDAITVASWWLLILLAANPQWFRLPGSGIISNFAVIIAAYIPAGLLIGAAAGWLAGSPAQSPHAQKRPYIAIQIALAGAVIIFSITGLQSRLKDDNPQGGTLFTRADLRAASWIDANLPQEAQLLVNAFFAYNDWVIVGSDGGWWLPLTARRQTQLPPINYGNENGPTGEYRQQVNALQAEILAKGISHPDVLQLLRQRGLRYIYIGQRQGRVNNAGTILDPQELLASPAFKPIYHQDRVYIFEILQ